MSIHHLAKLTTVIAIAGTLAACSTIAPTQSTLGPSADLKVAADGSQSFLKAPVNLQTEIHIAEVAVALSVESKASLSPDERAELTVELRRQLASSLRESYSVVEAATAKSHTLRATITDVRTSSVAGNIASTILLGLPTDKGGAAVEFELKSPAGERIAAMSVASQGKFVQFSGAYSKLGQAKLVLAAHAKSLAELLQGNVAPTARANT